MLEADFQRAVVDAATLYGWRSCHTRPAAVRAGRIATPTSVPGWPDLVLWNPRKGGVMFRELKTDKGRVSPEQAEVLASLRSARLDAAVWRPADWEEIRAQLAAPAEPDWRGIAVKLYRHFDCRDLSTWERDTVEAAEVADRQTEADKRWIAEEVEFERTRDAQDRGEDQ